MLMTLPQSTKKGVNMHYILQNRSNLLSENIHRLRNMLSFKSMLIKHGGVSGHDIISLEDYHRKVLSGRNINSYTETPSMTNYSYVLESTDAAIDNLHYKTVKDLTVFLKDLITYCKFNNSDSVNNDGSHLLNLTKAMGVLDNRVIWFIHLAEGYRRHLDELVKKEGDRKGYLQLEEIIIELVKETCSKHVNDVSIWNAYEIIASDTISQTTNRLVSNLFFADTRDYRLINELHLVLPMYFDALVKDVMYLHEAFYRSQKSKVPDENMVEKLTNIKELLQIQEAKDEVLIGGEINDYLIRSINQSPMMPDFLSKDDVQHGFFHNLDESIKRMLDIEGKIHDFIVTLSKHVEILSKYALAIPSSDTERVLYLDTVEAIWKRIMFLIRVISSLRSTMDSITSLTQSFGVIKEHVRNLLSKTAERVLVSTIAQDLQHTIAVKFKELSQELNADK